MRIMVVGTSGSGKSTLARRISALAGVPHIELDAINWQAGWRSLASEDPEEFRRRLSTAAAQEAWVSDGNYGKAKDLLLTRATHLIWLDYPRSLVMRRVIRRSFTRAVSKQELWPGTGNREHFRTWLDKEHPIRWAWDTYHRRRNDYIALIADPALAHISRHRIRCPAQLEALIRDLPGTK